MKFSKLLLSVFLTTFVSFELWADDTCAECKNKNMEGMPKVPNSDVLNAISSNYKLTFEDTSNRYCMELGQQSESTVNYYLKTELEKASYYSVEDYFQRPGCRVAGYGGNVLAPLLHIVVDFPESRNKFAEKVYNYYHKRRKNPELWLKAINAKNTEGETLLDYIEFRVQSKAYHNEGTLNAVLSIQKYICENGGVYSKYSNKKCP